MHRYFSRAAARRGVCPRVTRLRAAGRRCALVTLTAAAVAAQSASEPATAADGGFALLLEGSAAADDGAELAFTLSGPSRDDPVGGAITLGERRFEITKVSIHSLIGAQHKTDVRDSAEYAIFSSSFSPQTATGQPWVTAATYYQCDRPYNSFLAIYRVDGAEAIAALGDSVFAALSDSLDKSTTSAVYCFVSRPPQ